ncbi:hypothetical protein DU490_01100 [Halomonas sp. DQ26W]|uniref:hypothetical protein n=1 Tax=Halomonas sp. DQ26W TaxID=2282311 RepID=UPI000DF7D238|nr:hypothetical protein [Halomonas sp. DQ26W]RDB44913.1 hypothetical protein DU490_01100 [Halomonas sp. DQ26W]
MSKMMMRKLAILLLVGMTAGGLMGCGDDAGPAEQAGKNIDGAMEEAEERIKEMGESIQEEAERD